MVPSVHRIAVRILFIGLIIAALGCDYNSPAAPDSPTMPGPVGASISIVASGLSPGTVTVAAGQSVTLANNDSAAHEIVSGPVPNYDECPAINAVGRLEPGQSRQTGAMPNGSTCHFLDLLRTGDSRWQGTIAVQ